MFIKICGITTPADAELAASAGADAIGLNLVPRSPRFVDDERAREIVRAVAGHVMAVLVVADRSLDEMRALRDRVGARILQLHGEESAETLAALLPDAYKALRIGSADDAARATAWPGEEILVDAKVAGALGGTGTAFDWTLVRALSAARRVILAGGLTADNVAKAVLVARPWGVDVASGVEIAGAPRQKDVARMRAFVANARSADETR